MKLLYDLKRVLTPLSFIYGFFVLLRNLAYDSGVFSSFKLPGKTISVGNIVVGGTGKTPVTIHIAEFLKKQGAKVAILTRGYKGGLRQNESLVLIAGKITHSRGRKSLSPPDEAMLMSVALRDIPIIVGALRSKNARWYLSLTSDSPTHWILDDGFQHRSIQRDLDLVLLDASHPFDNGHLLPRGLLRENPASLNRADYILVTRSQGKDYKPSKPHIFVQLQSQWPIDLLKNPWQPKNLKPVIICGLGNPKQFLESVSKLGIVYEKAILLRDHEKVTKRLLDEIGEREIITTEKDYWRDPIIFSSRQNRLYLVQLHVEFSDYGFINSK